MSDDEWWSKHEQLPDAPLPDEPQTGEQLSDERPSDERPRTGPRLRRSTIVVTVGGILVVLGAFLPWVDTPLFSTLGVAMPIRFALIPIGLIVAGLGILLVVAALEHERGTEARFGILLALFVLAALVFTWLHLNDVTAIATDVGLGGVGIGMWVSAIGALLGIGGSLLD